MLSITIGLLVAAASVLVAALVPVWKSPSEDVWNERPHVSWLGSDVCTLEKVDARTLSRAQFEERYLEKMAVVLTGATDTDAFTKAVQKHALIHRYANHSVTLSSANKNSYSKREETLAYYVREMMRPQAVDALGNETWYHFGDNKHAEWKAVFDLYQRPKKYTFGPYSSMSFGIGASGTGVPFHIHGHVFAEVFYGRKRWWISPYEHEPLYSPDASSVSWLSYVYPELVKWSKGDADRFAEGGNKDLKATSTPKASAKISEDGSTGVIRTERDGPQFVDDGARRFPPQPPYFYECTLGAGELLYIPGRWHHSTLNIGETVFMSVFV